MNKILCIGDQHFDVKNLQIVEMFLAYLEKHLEENEYSFAVSMGDLLHNHELVHTLPLNMANRYIEILSAKNPVYILVGNHDMINASQFLTTNNFLQCYKHWPNVFVVDTLLITKINGQIFTFLPFVPNGRLFEALNSANIPVQTSAKVSPSRLPSYPIMRSNGLSDHAISSTEVISYDSPIRPLSWRDSACIFLHQEIYSCKLTTSGESSSVSDRWLPEYPFAVSGHIHVKQQLGANWFYVGNIIEGSYGEKHDKYMSVVETSSRSMEDRLRAMQTGVSISDNNFKIRDIKLHLPKKITMEMSIEEFKSKKFLDDPDLLDHPLDTFRIVVTSDSVEDFKILKKSVKFKKVSERKFITKIIFKSTRVYNPQGKDSEEAAAAMNHFEFRDFISLLKEKVKVNSKAVNLIDTILA